MFVLKDKLPTESSIMIQNDIPDLDCHVLDPSCPLATSVRWSRPYAAGEQTCQHVDQSHHGWDPSVFHSSVSHSQCLEHDIIYKSLFPMIEGTSTQYIFPIYSFIRRWRRVLFSSFNSFMRWINKMDMLKNLANVCSCAPVPYFFPFSGVDIIFPFSPLWSPSHFSSWWRLQLLFVPELFRKMTLSMPGMHFLMQTVCYIRKLCDKH